MTRSVRDLELFITTIQAAEPWRIDATVPAIPWLPVRADGTSAHPVSRPWAGTSGKLRIGVWADDGVVMPLAPVRRALDSVVSKLKGAADIELVEYRGFKQVEGWELIVSGASHGYQAMPLLTRSMRYRNRSTLWTVEPTFVRLRTSRANRCGH